MKRKQQTRKRFSEILREDPAAAQRVREKFFTEFPDQEKREERWRFLQDTLDNVHELRWLADPGEEYVDLGLKDMLPMLEDPDERRLKHYWSRTKKFCAAANKRTGFARACRAVGRGLSAGGRVQNLKQWIENL